jgi:hypothetical protein
VIRLAQLAAAVALAGVIAASASATESTINQGVGIGKITLGMTKAQVEHVLGRHDTVLQRTTVRSSAYMQLGWGPFYAWGVGFLKQRGTYRVVDVGTGLSSQQTSKRVGVGTLWLKVVRAYPGGVCSFGNLGGHDSGDFFLEYLVPHKGGTQTIYVLQGQPPREKATDFRVFDVHVRTAFQPLLEFAANYQYKCQPGWQTTRTPVPYGYGG